MSCFGRDWIPSPTLMLRGNPDAKIRIYAIDGVGPKSVHGAVQLQGGAWTAVEWTTTGRWDDYLASDGSFWDLVERP